MAETPEITLEQWRALVAVVEEGGYAQAAEVLHKSQSSVTYAVQKLESLLGVQAFELRGRKAVLTTTGQLLYRRARVLVEEALELERAAKKVSSGWEAEIRLVVEVLFPTWLLLECLELFGRDSPHTRIEVFETVLGGEELLIAGQADLAILPRVPPERLGEPLLRLRLVPAAHPEHPLHQLGRTLTRRDLRKYRHLVTRDSGPRRSARTTTVDVEQRWTVTNLTTSIEAARRGFGFAWYAEEKIRDELAAGTLKALPVRQGTERWAQMYLTFADPDSAGPGARRLADIIRQHVQGRCSAAV